MLRNEYWWSTYDLRNAMIETRPIAYLIDSIVPDVVESLHQKHLKRTAN